MKCLMRGGNFSVEVSKNHCQYHHSVNENNYIFKKHFLPDNNRKNGDESHIRFKSCRQRKNHYFLFYRSQQAGDSINQARLIDFLRRRPIVYYLIYFQQHKNYYDFSDESIANSFFILFSIHLHRVL